MKKNLGSVKIIGRILKDAIPISHWLSMAALFGIFSAILSMRAPELLGVLTNRIYDLLNLGVAFDREIFIKEIIKLSVIYLISAVLSALTQSIMNYSVTRHFTCRMRVRMSDKIARMPVKTIDATPNGEIISKMTRDVSIMGSSVHEIFSIAIMGIIRLIIISAVIFIANPIMALAVIVFVPLSMVLSALLAARSEKHFDKSRAEAGRVYSLCEENLAGFDAVKIFSIEKSQNARYCELIKKYSEHSERGYFTSGMVRPVVAFINNLSYIAICLLGSYLVITNNVNVGDLVAFLMYTKLFSGPLESIANGVSMMQLTIAASKRVYSFLDDEEMTPDGDNRPAKVTGEVIFENVGFSYKENEPLIEKLDLTVRPGEKVAIVGPTGGGKTTIVNLLMRFYDPQSGRILVDGKDISKMSRADVRRIFGMVLQDTLLFSGTVYDNIAYGKEGATSDEVLAAARAAHIDHFVDLLPNGYDTEINEDSTNISAGQKQLLTIARAYLSNRPILILDEATSNVDTRTELLIQHTMDELMKDRTVFVIAHRLSTVENADIILVIDGGRIVERGTHGELLEKNGLYAKIHRSQYPK